MSGSEIGFRNGKPRRAGRRGTESLREVREEGSSSDGLETLHLDRDLAVSVLNIPSEMVMRTKMS